jgi:hypothetical protein
MRTLALSVLLVLSVLQMGGILVTIPAPTTNAASSPTETKQPIDFDRQLKPIFQSKCSPCHFSGGQMYDRLPFDKPETIRKLGTRLFTRIKDENERRLIDEFIHQGL